MATTYPEIITNYTGLRVRELGLIILIIYMIISGLFCYFIDWKITRKLSVWAQSNLLFVFSIIYYLRLNNDSFNFLGYTFTSILIILPIAFLIFLVNERLFKRSFLKEAYLIGEMILLSLTTFSLVSLLDLSSFAVVENSLLQTIIDLPSQIWLGFTAFSVGLVSSLNLGTNKGRYVILYWLGFGFFSLQLMTVLGFLNFNYWYKSLLFLIFWDFIFGAVRAIVHSESTVNYRPKLLISSVYHITLFVVVFYFGSLIV
ncbi:hypothetical protein HC864_04925 [Candidatus Gracilibacteria bacterium]|nr:hypothetical protein [Candidatus Gracilibacteria bacterium]